MESKRLITYRPEEKYVRLLGRSKDMGEYRWLCLSGSGIEFLFNGEACFVTVKGDSSTEAKDGFEDLANQVRLGILVDGRMVIDTMVKKPVERYQIPLPEDNEEHTIRIIKLSASAMSTVGIVSLEADEGAELCPTAAKAKRIEFIGDSITCGYGVDAPSEAYTFTTYTENVTRAYAYLSAQKLDADYSMVSFSGHGLISGYVHEERGVTFNGGELVPPYYESLGWSYNRMDGRNPVDTAWDFAWQPDVVLINLGTNDSSYTKGIPERVAGYEKCYLDFLQTVRARNPKAHIICALGLMGDDLYPAVERVVEAHKAQCGDENISALHITPQDPEKNGYGADFHPSPVSHGLAAEEVAGEIAKWL